MSWNQLGEWWKAELATDPAYEEVVTPLLLEVLQPQPGSVYLDLGCGDGRVMVQVNTAGASPVGVEMASDLARLASEKAPTVIDRLPDLKSIRSQSVDGAYSVRTAAHQASCTACARLGTACIAGNHRVSDGGRQRCGVVPADRHGDDDASPVDAAASGSRVTTSSVRLLRSTVST
jgi:hypothetical protein